MQTTLISVHSGLYGANVELATGNKSAVSAKDAMDPECTNSAVGTNGTKGTKGEMGTEGIKRTVVASETKGAKGANGTKDEMGTDDTKGAVDASDSKGAKGASTRLVDTSDSTSLSFTVPRWTFTALH